jgi:hypothetical protein
VPVYAPFHGVVASTRALTSFSNALDCQFEQINLCPNPSPNPDEAIAGLEIIRARRAHFILPDELILKTPK